MEGWTDGRTDGRMRPRFIFLFPPSFLAGRVLRVPSSVGSCPWSRVWCQEGEGFSEVRGVSRKVPGKRFIHGGTQPVAREPCEVKQMFSSKMTLQVLVLCLAYSGLGKANVVPQNGRTEVRMGDSVTLRCALTEPKDVVQVTWQKGSEESNENIATYSTANGLKIHEPYKDRMNFTSLELNKTSITFWDSRMDDSGRYKCLFHVFPDGSYSGNINLSVFGLNGSVHQNISEDHLIVTCNAHGLPEPTITWNNLFNSTPTEKTVKHKNGIVSITSKLEIYNIQSISARGLTCTVSNTNEAVELPVKIKGEEGSSFPWWVIIVVLLVVITVLIPIMVFQRKSLCRRS